MPIVVIQCTPVTRYEHVPLKAVALSAVGIPHNADRQTAELDTMTANTINIVKPLSRNIRLSHPTSIHLSLHPFIPFLYTLSFLPDFLQPSHLVFRCTVNSQIPNGQVSFYTPVGVRQHRSRCRLSGRFPDRVVNLVPVLCPCLCPASCR